MFADVAAAQVQCARRLYIQSKDVRLAQLKSFVNFSLFECGLTSRPSLRVQQGGML